mmetsp:Transcript_3574/g.10622  ORF Transcript_3574/g.10622 Transcript_3574/m.10622 type:complete len:233 (-) Transcript_3574:26-724(-)
MVAWRRFATHDAYGNGLRRAQLRGWFYPVIAFAIAVGAQRLAPGRAAIARRTLPVYVVGAALHLVPFETARGYCRVLALDFLAITTVYSGHVHEYCRPTSFLLLLSVALSVLLAINLVSATIQNRDLQYHGHDRRLRVSCGIVQTLLLAFVEAGMIADAPIAALVVVGKICAFLYFYLGGRLDAARRWTFMTVPGLWEVHDNFHVLVLSVHCLQVYAAGLPRRDGGRFAAIC